MRSLVIFLHGVGRSGADFDALGKAWAGALPDTTFVAPDGPFPFDRGSTGRQWFSISGVTDENRPQRIVAARGPFDQTLAGIIDAHGFAGDLQRVALVGFSQGSIMSLDALVSGRWPVATIVAFSGRLASPEPQTPSVATSALLIHGTADQVMLAHEAEEARAQLEKQGVPVALHMIPGLGHSISEEGAAIALRHLTRVFA